jgi:GT2 family glycosyltransferase
MFIDVGPGAWWSAAVNVGVQRAIFMGYKAVLVLNDDLHFNINLVDSILAASKNNPDSIISASQEANSKISYIPRRVVFNTIPYFKLSFL